MPAIPIIPPLPAWSILPPGATLSQSPWAALQRGVLSNPTQLLNPSFVYGNLLAFPDPNVPASWQLFGVGNLDGTIYVPGVGTVPLAAAPIPPGYRLNSTFICTCANHNPLALTGHRYQQVVYLEPDIIDVDPLNPTWDSPSWVPKKVDVPERPIVKEEFNCDSNCLGLVTLIISLAVNAIANATSETKLWMGAWYGVTGNMFKLEETAFHDTYARQLDESVMRVRPPSGYPSSFPFSSEEYLPEVAPYFSHHTGMQLLPCFVESPLPKAVEVTVPVRFDGYVFMHTLQLRGAFGTEFPEGFPAALVQAYLGIDTAGAAAFEEDHIFENAFTAWRQQVYALAASQGLTLVNTNFQLIDPDTGEPDPNRMLFNTFVTLNTPPLPPKPVQPAQLPSRLSSPLWANFYELTRTYAPLFDLYKTRFIGLDFYRTNPLLVGMVRTGKKYKYIFADNTMLTIEGVLDEAMINSCFASHPAKAELLDLVTKHPIKPVYPQYTHPYNAQTNPFPCWGVPYEPRQVFAKMNDRLLPGMDLGKVIDSDTFMLNIPFDGTLEVPGTVEDGQILTYSAVPLFLVPNHGDSYGVHLAMTRSDAESIIADALPTITPILSIASMAFPPLAIIGTVISIAQTLLSLLGQTLQEGLRDQRNCNGFVFYRGFKSFPSKFKVCKTPITLPSPTNNSIRVLDYPNSKTETITSSEYLSILTGQPAPPGYVSMGADPDALHKTLWRKDTIMPMDQEVQPIKFPTSFTGTGLGGFPEV